MRDELERLAHRVGDLVVAGPADFVAAVLALSGLDAFVEMQDDTGSTSMVDTSGAGLDLTTLAGSIVFEETGPGGTDRSIRFSGGSAQRGSPFNSLTDGMAIGCWVQHVSSSVNLGLWEHGLPGSNGYGPLFVGSAALRGICHGVAFMGTSAHHLDDGLWTFVGMQRRAGAWELVFNGLMDANNPIGTSNPAAPTTKIIVNRDAADFRMAYLFSLSDTLTEAEWTALYTTMIGGAPSNSVPPVLSGAAVAGRTLTTDDGTWADADSFAYQWESSPDGLTSWTPISGETANAYIVEVGEIGNWLRCVVTASNGDGDTDEPSNALGPAIAALSGPVVVGAFSGDHNNGYGPTTWDPDTSGVLAGDYMVVTFLGAFTAGLGAIGLPGPEWETLDNDVVLGTGRGAVFGKLSYVDTPTETFTFPSAASFVGTLTAVRGGYNAETPISDYGKTTDNSLATVTYDTSDLVLGITLGNDAGSPADVLTIPAGFTDVIEEKVSSLVVSGWMTDSTKLEAAGADDTSGLSFTYQTGTDVYTVTILFEFDPGVVPVIVDDPVVTGVVRVAETLSCSEGTWTETPISFSYDWERSLDGSTGWSDVGPDADTYLIDIADEGYYFRCKVTASNVSGPGTPESSNVVGPAEAYPTIRRFTVSG